MHPLLPDLSKLTDEELHKKLSDLHSRLGFFHRTYNFTAVQQLQLLIADYDAEVQRRHAESLKELAAKSSDFKSIIDIQ